jgi:Tfp pilus assembly protein PilX
MTRRLRGDESGFALVMAIMLMAIALLIGITVMARADNQSQQSADERVRESSFQLSEAALNAQALQLSRSWPTAATTACTPSSTATSCPQASAITGGYTSKDYAQACPTMQTQPPLWETTIRDNASGEVYWKTDVTGRATYDANNDGMVWLRSTTYAQCKKVSIVSLASRSIVPIDFPSSVINANKFSTNNQGRKVIVDTLGTSSKPSRPASQPSPIVVRCSGLSQAQCLNYQASKGQVSPPLVQVDSTGSSSALTLAQLQSLEQQAAAAGTFFNGTCPSNASQLSSVNGAPVVIVGPCPPANGNMSFTGNTVINSDASPGVLVIENGTLTLGGTLYFYGLIYGVNKQGCACDVVSIGGNATVQGSIAVDGLGGVMAGSSKTNVIFDARAPALVKGQSGAALNKNTFRVLPPSTP